MTRLRVDPGACGLVAEVSAQLRDDGEVAVEVETPCSLVGDWAAQLAPLDPLTVLGLRGQAVTPFACAGCHAACPVPVAVLKAVEAEAGLALPRDVVIGFLTDH